MIIDMWVMVYSDTTLLKKFNKMSMARPNFSFSGHLVELQGK